MCYNQKIVDKSPPHALVHMEVYKNRELDLAKIEKTYDEKYICEYGTFNDDYDEQCMDSYGCIIDYDPAMKKHFWNQTIDTIFIDSNAGVIKFIPRILLEQKCKSARKI